MLQSDIGLRGVGAELSSAVCEELDHWYVHQVLRAPGLPAFSSLLLNAVDGLPGSRSLWHA